MDNQHDKKQKIKKIRLGLTQILMSHPQSIWWTLKGAVPSLFVAVLKEKYRNGYCSNCVIPAVSLTFPSPACFWILLQHIESVLPQVVFYILNQFSALFTPVPNGRGEVRGAVDAMLLTAEQRSCTPQCRLKQELHSCYPITWVSCVLP